MSDRPPEEVETPPQVEETLHILSDGEFVHLLSVAQNNADRGVLIKQMVLRKFGEISGLVNTALSMTDRENWHKTKIILAAARDASMESVAVSIAIGGQFYEGQIKPAVVEAEVGPEVGKA